MEYYGYLSLFDLSRTEGNTLHHFNVPCAACMAKGTANQVIMKVSIFCYYKSLAQSAPIKILGII